MFLGNHSSSVIPAIKEVVLGITPSGFVTVWTITGKEALHSTIHEHESRRVKTSSPVLEIHCCQQLPRLVLLVCVSEWRILDAFDCSTQILQSSESSDVRFIGGAFFHKEFVAVYTSVAEARIYRLPRDLFSKMGDRIENTGRKPQLVAILKTKGKLDRELARHFRHLAVNKSRRPALGRLGAPSDAVTAFLAGTSDGSLQVWTLTTEQLVTSSGEFVGPLTRMDLNPTASYSQSASDHQCKVTIALVRDVSNGMESRRENDQQPLDLKPFLQTSLSDVWSKLLKAPSPTTSFFDIASSFAVLPDPPAEKLTITCCIVIYSTSAPLHSSKVPPASPPSHPCPPPLPPRVVLATASGDIIVAQLAPLLHSLWLPDQSPCRSEQYRLRGHRGPVLALLHPYSFARDKSAFRASLLVSGGEDCSVRAWDLDPHPTESRLEAHCLAVFHNHAAPVIALTVGPTPDSACGVKSTFLSSCVACVAADGTVSVISPQDRFTLLRARSGFGGSPVGGGGYGVPLGIHAISWRVVEMLLLILADDGSLSIWDLGLGQLERYETGAVALDIFNTGTDTVVISSRPSPLSLATITPANQSASAASTRHRVVPSRLTRRNRHTDQSRFLPPLVLQALGSNVGGGPAAIVFHYDIEAIITNLLSTAVSSKDTSSHSSHDIPLGLQDCANLLKILLSLIFPWGVSSAQSDEEIADGLQLTPPTSTRPDVLLGAISRSGYLSIKMPVPPSSRATTSIYTLSSRVSTRLCLSQVAIAEALCYAPVSRLAGTFKSSSAATMAISVCSSPAIIPRLSLHLLLAHWQAKCLHVSSE
ncbi:unnamed protein product [Mesocestoides corti]|uniref:Uncharacterized protein n=1 Tax=Mesocestoides corti TaxID=53468 RepID=A0A0R3U9H3_MESCO|nr:unnamed protein product [Mesocestoides corti]